jgi:hypothetical protein
MANWKPFDATSVFLTYPQCDKTKEELLAWLKDKHALDQWVVARELHEDGNPHLHAVCKFSKRVKHNDCRFWDWLGHHPNIQRPRSAPASAKYCRKGGDFLASQGWSGSGVDAFPAALAASTGRDDFLRTVLASDRLSNRWNAAVGIADYVYAERPREYEPLWASNTYTNKPDGIDQWVQANLIGKTRLRLCVARGRART